MHKITSAVGIFCIVHLLSICGPASAWDNDELEVFDVVEEVNQNFYELMGISQNANASDLKEAFRKLSLQLHPDKNNAEDAEIQFRNLVAVYDVLKDPGKREKYNDVSVNGLPKWRSVVYYYRHVRKMGLLEMSVILFIVITIGQYLVAWAAYFEKRYTYEQVLGSRLQKMQKKNRNGKMGEVPDLADILEKIPSPSVKNTLPFQLPRWTYASVVEISSAICAIRDFLEERKRRKQEEEAALALEQEESEPEPVSRVARRRRAAFAPQEHSGESVSNEGSGFKRKNFRTNDHVYEKPKIARDLWTDDGILELIKLVKKYPGGTPDRWEKIADLMSRTVSEVTHKKIPSPSVKNTLPFQLPRWTYASVVGIPSAIRAIRDFLEERKRRKQEEEAALALEQEESEPEPVSRVARRRRAAFAPQEHSGESVSNGGSGFKRENFRTNNHVYEKPKVAGGLWTDDDILELIKLVKKYPGGTPDRWEKIADLMSRTVSEVTHMAKKVKDEGLKPSQPNEVPGSSELEQPKKIKTRADDTNLESSTASDWSQEQQKALETALLKHPKSATSFDRWEKIASCIEGKTKEECQVRYRQLVQLVKKKQQHQQPNQ